MPGPTELFILLGIALLIFGPKKVPEFIKNLGESMGSFRKAQRDAERAITDGES